MFGKCKYDTNLFRIAKEIKATDVISKIIAFQPPKKRNILYFKSVAQYSIEPLNSYSCNFKTKQKHCCRSEKVRFVHDVYSNICYRWIEEDCYTFKNTKDGSKNKDKNIVILHLKNKK
jgi:hypothetical protein